MLAARVEARMHDVTAQIELADEFFGRSELVERYRKVATDDPDARVFGPQSLYTLMRVLVEHAYEAPITQALAMDEQLVLMRAVVAANSAIEWGVEPELGPGREDLLAYELQVGSYYSRPPWLEEMARHRELYRLATNDPELMGSRVHEPVDKWLERSGLTAEEQWSLGFALSSQGPAWDPEKHPHVPAARLAELLRRAGLAGREAAALGLISSSRTDLQAAFVELKATGRRFVWELRPFTTTPYLRVADGGLLLLGRPWIVSWLGEGFHYRAMKVAQAEDRCRADGRANHVQNYTAYAGQVFEHYCLWLALGAISPPATVLGEQAYGKGHGKKTSDVAVRTGSDLVLFEANARRVGAEPLATGDPLEAADEITRLVVKKINQLGVCIGALLAGEAVLPDTDIADVGRIWPVVVAAGHVWQTSNLWRYLDSARDPDKCKPFQDSRVQPLQLLDASEYEKVLALVREGSGLPELLERKVGGHWRKRDLAVWLHEDPQAPNDEARLPALEAVWKEMTSAAAEIFGADN
jgi:hypothetical protein